MYKITERCRIENERKKKQYDKKTITKIKKKELYNLFRY